MRDTIYSTLPSSSRIGASRACGQYRERLARSSAGVALRPSFLGPQHITHLTSQLGYATT